MIALLAQRLFDRARPEADEDELHIELPLPYPGSDDDDKPLRMLCGLSATIVDATGRLSPNIDFYGFEAGHKASCKECLARFKA